MKLWIYDLIWGCLFCVNFILSTVLFIVNVYNLPIFILGLFSFGLASYCFIWTLVHKKTYKELTVGKYIKNNIEELKKIKHPRESKEINSIIGLFIIPLFYFLFMCFFLPFICFVLLFS